jgi:hypothetical protein
LLDRSIDRKVRILLRLRKESASLAGAAGGRGGAQRESVAAAIASSPENGELVEAHANIKLKERSGNVAENKGPRFEKTDDPQPAFSDRRPQSAGNYSTITPLRA